MRFILSKVLPLFWMAWCSVCKMFLLYEVVIIIIGSLSVSVSSFLCIAKYSLVCFPFDPVLFEFEPFFEKGFLALIICSWSILRVLAKLLLPVSCGHPIFLDCLIRISKNILGVFQLVIWQRFRCITLFFFFIKALMFRILQKIFLTCLFLILCSLTWFNSVLVFI